MEISILAHCIISSNTAQMIHCIAFFMKYILCFEKWQHYDTNISNYML
jgi:hypothetical protein